MCGLCQPPSRQQQPPIQRDSSTWKFHLLTSALSCFLESKISQWVYPAFLMHICTGSRSFFVFPSKRREIREAKERAMSKFNPFILLVIPVQSTSLIFLEKTWRPFNLLEGRGDEPENEWIISKCRQSMGELCTQCWPCSKIICVQDVKPKVDLFFLL